MHIKILSLVCKKEIIIVLIFSILISGCYTYNGVTRPDYLKKENHNKTKFILKDNEELIIYSSDTLSISYDDHSITFIKDSTVRKISFYDIKEIKEEKFDYGKTLFSVAWTLIGGFLVLSLIIMIIILLSTDGPMSVG